MCSLAEVSDSEGEEEEETRLRAVSKQPTYAEEQEELKESFKGAVVEMEEEESDGEDVLTLRQRTKEEQVGSLSGWLHQ